MAHDTLGRAAQATAWRATALALLGRHEEAERTLIDGEGSDESPLFQVRVDIARARAWRLIGRPEHARPILNSAVAHAEEHGHRFFQLIAHHEAALVATDDVDRARHERQVKALAASIAGSLPREDQARFLAQPWDKPIV